MLIYRSPCPTAGASPAGGQGPPIFVFAPPIFFFPPRYFFGRKKLLFLGRKKLKFVISARKSLRISAKTFFLFWRWRAFGRKICDFGQRKPSDFGEDLFFFLEIACFWSENLWFRPEKFGENLCLPDFNFAPHDLAKLATPLPHSVSLHARLSWFMFWNCYTGQSFPKKFGAVWFVGYWRATSKSRRTSCELGRKSRLRHTLLRRQKVGCPRVLEPAVIAHRSPLSATWKRRSKVSQLLDWRQLPVFTLSRTLVDFCLFHCRRQFGSQFRLYWTLAVVGWRKVLS